MARTTRSCFVLLASLAISAALIRSLLFELEVARPLYEPVHFIDFPPNLQLFLRFPLQRPSVKKVAMRVNRRADVTFAPAPGKSADGRAKPPAPLPLTSPKKTLTLATTPLTPSSSRPRVDHRRGRNGGTTRRRLPLPPASSPCSSLPRKSLLPPPRPPTPRAAPLCHPLLRPRISAASPPAALPSMAALPPADLPLMAAWVIHSG